MKALVIKTKGGFALFGGEGQLLRSSVESGPLFQLANRWGLKVANEGSKTGLLIAAKIGASRPAVNS